ncbi:ABC transporter permease [Algicola sagamiensis]|uniref:ABC transporter permease n=1 Tax=Algicola sagamiensis TaxID=163869 RepID=UPI0003707823|nr:iron ABC transporter permease [Algicola sagamiensis]
MNRVRITAWHSFSWAAGILLSLPLLALFFQSLSPDNELFVHLWNTVFTDYLTNSILLLVGVLCFSAFIAIPLAWLNAMCEYPLKRFFSWSLMLPLAMPAYLIAAVYTELLDYAGPIQVWLRQTFGWQSPQDYWFFDIVSLAGAVLMLSLVLFPYLYLILRSFWLEHSYDLIRASRVMQHSPWQSFIRVSLPMARGAIVAALALIGMETLADFATVHLFSVNTLTTAVYDTWIDHSSLGAAAKISCVMLLMIFLLIGAEKVGRRQRAVHDTMAREKKAMYTLTGGFGWLAAGVSMLILLLSFFIPVGVLVYYAVIYAAENWRFDFLSHAWNSFQVATIVSLICIALSVGLVIFQRFFQQKGQQIPGQLASTGYAIPGTVLAIGVLIPLTLLDHQVNHWFGQWFDWQPGLIFSGTVFAITFAYVVRFNAIAVGTLENTLAKVSPSIDMAGRTMKLNRFQLMYKVHFPLLRRGCLTAGLLIFIEAMKELPAALLLRPFDYQTLATYIYQYVSDEQLELSALAALFIVGVGLIPLFVVNRNIEAHGR